MPHRTVGPRFIAAGLLSLLALGACGSITGSEGEEYIIRIYNFTAPDTHPADAVLRVQVNGYIGPTSCYKFKRFETERTEAALHVTAIGIRKDVETSCEEGIRLLNDTVSTDPPFGTPFELVGHQPGGGVVVDTVHIR